MLARGAAIPIEQHPVPMKGSSEQRRGLEAQPMIKQGVVAHDANSSELSGAGTGTLAVECRPCRAVVHVRVAWGSSHNIRGRTP